MNNNAELTNHSLKSIFWPKKAGLMNQVALVLFGVLILAMASQLVIPILPVPITFQSATVILIAMAYGPRYGTSVVAAYLLAGICGMPVFEDFSAGTHVFYGPTAGYLIGFLPAAWLTGYLAQKGWGQTIVKSFVVACLGTGIIFACGLSVLSLQVGWENAVAFGLMPFIFSEPVKLIAAATLIPRFWKKS